jgi:hypothetical protein
MILLRHLLREGSNPLPKPKSIEFSTYKNQSKTSTVAPRDIEEVYTVRIEFSTREERDSFFKQMPSSVGGAQYVGTSPGIQWIFKTVWVPGKWDAVDAE